MQCDTYKYNVIMASNKIMSKPAHSNPHMQRGSHHFHFSYPKSRSQKIYHLVFVPAVILVVLFLVSSYFTGVHYLNISPSSINSTVLAMGATFIRILIAFVFALVFSIPLSILITKNETVERFLLPLFDILQSAPVLAFFPVIITVFISSHFIDGAAIFIFFLSMLWTMIFSLVGGLRVIPEDVKHAAKIFQIKGLRHLRSITIPSIVPYIVTGSILAWAQCWNISIVAEVLHTYIKGGTSSDDLFGIGGLLVQSSVNGNQSEFFLAIIVMVIFIAILNIFVWQKLLNYSEKFKFE